MKTCEARQLGERIGRLVADGRTEQAYALLAPALSQRTPFRFLGLIGEAAGSGKLEGVNAFLERVALERTEGGWVVIGSALAQQLDRDCAGAFARCRGYILQGDVWYASDILSERVPGPGLVADLDPSLALLEPWRADRCRWVRRAVGVSVHFWAKRSRGAVDLAPQAEALLGFLEPTFDEWEMDAVKGVAWGLKTLGKHYPDLVTEWLAEQLVQRRRRHRAHMSRKALTFLSDEQRARATGLPQDEARVPGV